VGLGWEVLLAVASTSLLLQLGIAHWTVKRVKTQVAYGPLVGPLVALFWIPPII